MKKIIFASLVCLLFAGCAMKNSPKYISEDYIKALDVPTSTRSYISAKDIDTKVQQDFDELQKELENIGGVEEFKIIKNTQISETIRELQIECKGKNGQFVDKIFYTINIDGTWKLIQAVK